MIYCPECGIKNNLNSNFCTSCGYDLRLIPEKNKLVPNSIHSENERLNTKSQSFPHKKEPKSSKEIIRGILGFMVLMFIIVGVSNSCLESDEEKEEERKNELKTNAYIISTQFVNDYLKAPSTSDFPLCGAECVQSLGNDRFKVKSYVDAENTFGAKVRTDYIVILKYKGGDEQESQNWILEDLKLIE